MTGYWDIHNHILPGVDDGSGCMRETMEMLEEEYRQGVRHIVFTPHYRRDMFAIPREEIQTVYARVCEMAADRFVSPQNFAAVMCFKASLLKKYRTVNCIDIGDGTVDLLVIRNGKPDLSVRVSDRSGMAVLRSEISNAIQQNYGIHLDSSDVEQVLMQEETILDEEIILEIQRMAENWLQRIINKLHTHVTDFRTNPAVFLGGGSLLLRKQIENSPEFKYVEFIDEVRANAIGYEKLTTARLRRG